MGFHPETDSTGKDNDYLWTTFSKNALETVWQPGYMQLH